MTQEGRNWLGIIGTVTGILGLSLGVLNTYNGIKLNERTLQAEVHTLHASFRKPLKANQPWAVAVEITNFGKTEAKVGLNLALLSVNDKRDLPSLLENKYPKVMENKSWPAGFTQYAFLNADEYLDSSFIKRLKSGESWIYVRGKLFYQDLFTNETRSELVCFVYPEIAHSQDPEQANDDDLYFGRCA